jgi:hypothetical protein
VKIVVEGRFGQAAFLGKIPGETPFDGMEGATRSLNTRDNACSAQMREDVLERRWDAMQGGTVTTPIPEKHRDYLFVNLLHCSVSFLKPTAETGDHSDLLLCGPSCIPSLRQVPDKCIDVGTEGAKVQTLQQYWI